VILVIDRLTKRLGRGSVLDFAVAAVAAVGLWAIGLSEVSWAPFFVVAVSAATPGGCLPRIREAARS
jgi:hypothetical protein